MALVRLDTADDAGGLDGVLRDSRALCVYLGERFAVPDDDLLAFFSGSRGFHVGLPLGGFNPEPGPMFHKVARRFAESIAEQVGITTDVGVYDRVRAFRAPNSRHPKTGLFKRRFTVDELMNLNASRIVELAGTPEAFDITELDGSKCGFELPAAWNNATEQVRQEAEVGAEKRRAIANGDAEATLNRQTLDFIHEGATTGDRHRLLFSAAANLAECGATLHLCEQLLRQSALDSGLSPADVERQIRCGYEHAKAAELPMVRDVLDTFPDAEITDVTTEGGVA